MAMILGALVGKCVERIAASVEESATLVLGIKDDLEDLQRKLQMIRSVLKDAERRRIQDKAVDLWLKQLEDVMYDAEDILEHCKFKRPRLLQDQPTSSSASSVRSDSLLSSSISDVSFRHKIGKKIKKLNDRLERIGKDKDMFMFTVELSKPDDIRRPSGVNLLQTSPLEEDDVVGSGIQEATNQLVELILVKQNQNCRVFAILGMGGIGKTTLAQKLYNEPRIQSNFQEHERVWVCISQSFSDIDLLKQIIRSAGGHHGDAQTKAELEPLLINVIRGKRLFLVLDDVWRADVWVDLLRKPLRQGGTASCTLVVTTRIEDVARSMGAEHVHRVEKLSIESGWDMLRKRIFMNGEEEEIQSLKDIGMQIVKKCHGLPLAIKTIAGVLSAKDRTSTEWERVLRSSRWTMSQLPDGVGGALYLSYDDLPSDLKQCFLYLSLFPEDYQHKMSQLVPLWIAEGLVETHGSNSLEDTAEEHYTELIRRSLLQPVTKPFPIYYPKEDYFGPPDCQMHDLLRSLACYLSGNNYFCGNVESISTSDASQSRRLFIQHTWGSAGLTTDSIIGQKRLRTLMLSNRYSTVVIENDLISRLRRLRVLHINWKGFNCLPDSIGDLIYLRYLNLDYTAVSELPGSLGCLTNLQFLSLSHCYSLHCKADPIRGLVNLRYLNLDRTGVSKLSESLACLTNLRFLSLSMCKSLFCVPDSIGGLIHLRHLNLGYTDVSELPESLGSLTNLQFLSLYVCQSLHSVPDSIGDLIHLRYLNLSSTAVSELPQSLGGLTNLQFLSVESCNSLQSVLDSIGGLIQMRFLNLAGSRASQLPESLGPLKNLQFLNLSFCGLHSVPDSIGGLRQLRSLHLGANELSELPESLGRLTNLQSLTLHCCRSFHSVPDAIGGLIHLRDLDLSDSAVSELPDSLGRLTNLQSLHLSNCKSLHTFPQVITRLCNLRCLLMTDTSIRHVPKEIDKLQQLQELSGFVLGDDDSIAVAGKTQQGQGCQLEDLLDLSNLRSLGIERLERASTGMLVALRSLPQLMTLSLRCSQQTDGDGQQSNTEEEMAKIIKIEEIFNELVLPKRLTSLTLDGGLSRSYPSWMSSTSSLPELDYIRLENFKSCPQVPPLGELPQLTEAFIKGATAIVTIGPEFMRAGVREGIHELTSIAFPKLESLHIEEMANWEEWSFGSETEERAAGQEGRIENRSPMSFPCLNDLYISDCPKLRTLPISGLPALKSLRVHSCLALKDVGSLPALKSLRVHSCLALKDVGSLPALELLEAYSCPALKDVGSLPALKSLWVNRCPALKDVGSQNALNKLELFDYEMECLPEWLIQLLQQRSQDEDSSFRLKLNCKAELLRKCLKGGPYWPTIQQIPRVGAKYYRKGQRLYLNYTKDPYSYKTNLSGSHDPNV